MTTNNSANQSSTGLQSLTSGGVFNGRTITAGTGISVTDGDGIAANPTVSLSTPVSVSNGGTGATSLTAHSVLIGEGTSAVVAVGPGLAGQVLTSGGAGADPSFVSPTAGTGLTLVTNATTLQYALSTPVSTTNGGTGVSAPTAHTLPVAEGASAFTFLGPLTNGQLLIGSTGADPVPATITAGSGISITNAAGSITIANTGAGFAWTDVTGTTQTIAVENGYIADNAGLVTFTLPATAAIGDSFIVMGKGGGGWAIAQNAGQQIHLGNTTTTAGVGGSLASTNQWDSVTATCVTAGASTIWAIRSSMGNITIV